ncbi:hypothetical protein FQN50_001201 [Emmonsiellopsis sp. PD_5]|nr:hypothetical protein FQN50_001201 [Emmonsiellopsis sp. PD_5]
MDAPQRNLDSEGLQPVVNYMGMDAPERNLDSAGLQSVVNGTGMYAPERNLDSEGLQIVSPKENTYGGVVPPDHKFPPSSSPSTILGVRRKVFYIYLAVLLVVIAAAAIGGGVGGSMASRGKDEPSSEPSSSSSSPSPTPPPTATVNPPVTRTSSSSFVTSGTTGLAQNLCPDANQTDVKASNGASFKLFCGVDWYKELDGLDGGVVHDLEGTFQYTLQDCLDQCTEYNRAAETKCKAVVYQANLTRAAGGGYKSCYIKDRVGVYAPGDWTVVSASMNEDG